MAAMNSLRTRNPCFPCKFREKAGGVGDGGDVGVQAGDDLLQVFF